MHQEEAFEFFLDTKNKKAFPLNLACPEYLKCSFTSRSTLVRWLVSWPLPLPKGICESTPTKAAMLYV